MLNGRYPVDVIENGIPTSDCAAEVVEVGSDVKIFGHGDHVAPIFFLNDLTGEEDDPKQALGGDVEGVLREYAVYDEKVLVHLPKSLSWEEVSALNPVQSFPHLRSFLANLLLVRHLHLLVLELQPGMR